MAAEGSRGAAEGSIGAAAYTVDLSIIAVTYNSAAEIEAFLGSIYSERARASVEVIVVDNQSADGTVQAITERWGNVRVLVSPANAGYALAMNRGIAAARGKYLLLCNPDIVFRAGALDAMRDCLEARPELGGTGPLIETAGEPGSAAALYPALTVDTRLYYGWSFFSGIMQKFARSRALNWHVDHAGGSGRETLPWLHGCCAMYRRTALAAVGGGFDERFFLYFEDADLGRSLREWGWKLAVAPGARVQHLEERSARPLNLATRAHFMESWHKYQRKHENFFYRGVCYLVVLAALVLQSAVQLVKCALGRAHALAPLWAYLRVHLGAPFRNLEYERECEVARIHAWWDDTDTPAARVSSPRQSISTPTL